MRISVGWPDPAGPITDSPGCRALQGSGPAAQAGQVRDARPRTFRSTPGILRPPQRVYAGAMRIVILAVALAIAAPAEAFCGFYVAPGDQPMFNDATQVVLMRQGTRTVLAMQNNYKGPPEAFAMVVPVPTVLHEGDVKILTRDVFGHVERMGAPRLVEYWEQDPCEAGDDDGAQIQKARFMPAPTMRAGGGAGFGVTVEAQFAVGEYQVVILSAKDSTGLEAWLAHEQYRIPAGAEPLLRPYVEAGSKFFVAKVDPQKVAFDKDGRAALSPLRFHYDSEEFALPIRLGMASSSGTQDLIVNILAPHQRYEVANYKNVTIPTNLDVTQVTRDRFPAFYAALFDRTIEKHPGAVVTEYAWSAGTCDPCPGPTLSAGELATLGADVLGTADGKPAAVPVYDLVLTRLHARYGKALTDDLRFREAPAIAGGREVRGGQGLETGARPAPVNNFQARYAIRHPWTGPIRCEHPVRQRWGGPPAEIASEPGFRPVGTEAATGLAFAPRGGLDLGLAVRTSVPELGITAGVTATAPPAAPPAANGSDAPAAPAREPRRTGCGCASSDAPGGLVVLLAALALRRRRR
jgi:MYXO-CTERM domain-containing protein